MAVALTILGILIFIVVLLLGGLIRSRASTSAA
jgi:hypothetical protein